MKNYIVAGIFGISIMTGAYLLGKGYQNRNKKEGTINVTGLGQTDFVSDLIVWEGSFESSAYNLNSAYSNLESDKVKIERYLDEMGIDDADIVFSAVKTQNLFKNNYSSEGKYLGELFNGYKLTQTVKIESKNVKQVEKVSRKITELLNKGVTLYSQPPRYYYTKLAELKQDMIAKATEDARLRAENISKNSGGNLGGLKIARMGIFQITGQNSTENHSWGGTFNTSSKKKTASITMKLEYKID